MEQEHDAASADVAWPSNAWVVATVSTARYIGKVTHIDACRVATLQKDLQWSADFQFRDEVMSARWLTLQPAYDYFLPLQQVQRPEGIGIVRAPVLMQLDLAFHESPVCVSAPQSVVFFFDMHADDAKVYEDLIENTRKAILGQRLAQRSGLVMPGAIKPKAYDGRP